MEIVSPCGYQYEISTVQQAMQTCIYMQLVHLKPANIELLPSEMLFVEIMDIPYLHGEDIWTEYRIPNIDRISYVYLGFVS